MKEAREKDTAAKYETLTAQVQAGKTYYIYANGATANILKITFATKTAGTAAQTAVQAQTAKASDGRQVKLSWNAVENGAEEVFYGVDTYVDGEKVDITDGITGTETIMDRLSSGVTYTFKVYVSEKGYFVDLLEHQECISNDRIMALYVAERSNCYCRR